MANIRKRHTAEFKSKVALEALRGQKTSNELTADTEFMRLQINTWKQQALAAIPEAFCRKKGKVAANQQAEMDELHRQIGQLISERDWLKKSPQAVIG